MSRDPYVTLNEHFLTGILATGLWDSEYSQNIVYVQNVYVQNCGTKNANKQHFSQKNKLCTDNHVAACPLWDWNSHGQHIGHHVPLNSVKQKKTMKPHRAVISSTSDAVIKLSNKREGKQMQLYVYQRNVNTKCDDTLLNTWNTVGAVSSVSESLYKKTPNVEYVMQPIFS